MSEQADNGATNGSEEAGFVGFLKQRKVPLLLCLGVAVLIVGVIRWPLPPKPDPVWGKTHIERVDVSGAVLAWKDVGPVHHEHAPIVVHFEGLNLPSDYPKAVLTSARWPEIAKPVAKKSNPEKLKELAKERENIIAEREYHDYSFSVAVLETSRDEISVRVHRNDGSSHAGWKPSVRVQVLVIP